VIQPDNSGSLVLQTNSGTTALTIDTSQRAAFVAGTAALPAITTTGDTNTGIFFPAADTIAFAEGGTEVMRIDSSGRVTNPYQPAFFAIANGAYTVGNDIVYNEVSVNQGSYYSSSTGRFTAPVTGLYYFSMKNLQINTAAVIRFYFYKNGSVLGSGATDGGYQSRFENSTGIYKEQQTSSIIQMSAGDYVTVRQIAGTASVDTSGYSTFLGHLIG
jgi:hypothetical protein